MIGIVSGRGLWVQQGTGPDSGMFIFGAEASETDGLAEGKEIDLTATSTIYTSSSSCSIRPSRWRRRPARALRRVGARCGDVAVVRRALSA